MPPGELLTGQDRARGGSGERALDGRPEWSGGLTVGVLEVTGAWASAIIWLKVHWLSGYTPPI
jgi:hypothetical protein